MLQYLQLHVELCNCETYIKLGAALSSSWRIAVILLDSFNKRSVRVAFCNHTRSADGHASLCSLQCGKAISQNHTLSALRSASPYTANALLGKHLGGGGGCISRLPKDIATTGTRVRIEEGFNIGEAVPSKQAEPLPLVK